MNFPFLCYSFISALKFITFGAYSWATVVKAFVCLFTEIHTQRIMFCLLFLVLAEKLRRADLTPVPFFLVLLFDIC